MISYFLTGSNNYTFRIEDINSGSALSLKLQNMYTLVNTSQSITGYSFNDYENILGFTASISGARTGDEWRATIQSGSAEVWHGTIQVYTSESNNTTYTTQNDQYVSHITDNEFIIM
jgi:hypothetical protein